MLRRGGVVACIALALVAPVRPASADQLPQATFACGDEVTRSVRLVADVGYPGGCSLTGLRVTEDGVTLDLNGHTIWGNRTDNDVNQFESGVVVGGRREVRVVGGAVRGFEIGLLSSGAPKLVVRGVTFADHSGVGMSVGSRGARLQKNAVTAIGGTGMSIFGDSVVADGNIVTDTQGSGITLGGAGASVTRNTVADNVEGGIDVSGSGATIERNVAASNDGNGIELTGAEGGVIRANRSVSNGGHGIFVFNTGPMRIIGNRVVDNSLEGVFVDGDEATIVRNVVSANTQDGIQVDGDDAVLRGNRADGNTGSGLESDGLRAAFDGNRATGNRASGIHVAGGTATAGGNRTVGNGFATVDGSGPGIDAGGAVISLTGTNVARANDDATCEPAGACADEHTDLPVEHPGCGTVVDHSFRLGSSIGSMLSRCPEHGLIIEKNDITVDLGGFGIWGSVSDDGVSDPDIGIWVKGERARVFGGRVIGFDQGVRVEKGRVSDVVVQDAQRTAFVSTLAGRLASVAAAANDGDGFSASGGLTHGVSHSNTGVGIRSGASGPGRVQNSVASLNGENGLLITGEDGLVTGTTAIRNGEIGIETRGNDSRVARSISMRNGTTGVFAGTSAAGARSTVRGGISGRNSGVGIAISGKESIIETSLSVDDVNNGIALGANADGSDVTRNIAIGAGFHGVLANANGVLLRANRALGNTNGGIRVGVNGVRVIGNRAIGNPVGIFTDVVKVKIDGNIATGNGFDVVNETGLGIDASDAVAVSGRNVAYGNDDPAGCDPASLC